MSDIPFVDSSDAPWTRLADGIERQVLSYGPDLMVVRVRFEAGAVGAMALSRHADPETGDYEEPLMLGHWGKVPDAETEEAA